jgi:hypothetical protein
MTYRGVKLKTLSSAGDVINKFSSNLKIKGFRGKPTFPPD